MDGAVPGMMVGPVARKASVLGIRISLVDYEGATDFIVEAGKRRESRIVSAMAVHGVMTGVLDREHGERLNAFDMLTPDGQPVRWAVNLAARAGLRDRVYGPELTKRVCAAAARHAVPVYLYGSRPETVGLMRDQLLAWYPNLQFGGVQPSRFRAATPEEDTEDVERINASGAGIVLVGLGCPRQERWAFDHKGRVHAAMVCVGAAFDFIAGLKPQAPPWIQRFGLEWLYRLGSEPRRLWARYLVLNPLYLLLLTLQLCRIWRPGEVKRLPLDTRVD